MVGQGGRLSRAEIPPGATAMLPSADPRKNAGTLGSTSGASYAGQVESQIHTAQTIAEQQSAPFIGTTVGVREEIATPRTPTPAGLRELDVAVHLLRQCQHRHLLAAERNWPSASAHLERRMSGSRNQALRPAAQPSRGPDAWSQPHGAPLRTTRTPPSTASPATPFSCPVDRRVGCSA